MTLLIILAILISTAFICYQLNEVRRAVMFRGTMIDEVAMPNLWAAKKKATGKGKGTKVKANTKPKRKLAK